MYGLMIPPTHPVTAPPTDEAAKTKAEALIEELPRVDEAWPETPKPLEREQDPEC